MTRYVIRRILRGIGLLLGASALTFLLFYVLPAADPARLRAGRDASPQLIAHVTRQLGLDRPIAERFLDYIRAVFLHFDFGYSYYSRQSVLSLIVGRLPATLSLIVGAALLAILVAVPLAMISAIRRGAVLDRVAMSAARALVSTPAFWLGLVMLALFARDVGDLPILPGANAYVPLTVSPVRWFTSLLLPWLVLATTQAAIYSRLLRGNLREVMGEDFIRTARAKGVRERRVVWRHGARPATTSAMTALGLDIGGLLGGAVLVETVFGIPGIGRLDYEAIAHHDLPIVQGTVLLAAMFVIVVSTAIDVLHAYVDPRAPLT
jgi:peptide/nickel transport system permease protein